jgi:hypothetical protein
MSHMVKGTTNFSEENKDIFIEALKEAYPGCEVQLDTQMSSYGRQMCDIVVNRKKGGQLGFRKNSEGNYDCHTYEGGYGNGDRLVQKALKPVYEPYVKGVAKDMMKRNPNLRNYRMGKTTEVDRKGKKMKRVRLSMQGGGGY